MGLDFSALQALAYRGCETPEDKRLRDLGFSIVEDGENPFEAASEAVRRPSEPRKPSSDTEITNTPGEAAEGKTEAFTDAPGMDDHREFFRAAFSFYRKWLPHPAEPEDWGRAAEEMGRICGEAGNDPLLMDLLRASYEALARNYAQAMEGR